jgi:hypothetical protein
MVLGAGQTFSTAFMAMNYRFSITLSTSSSSTKTSFDLLDEPFFFPIHNWRSPLRKRAVATRGEWQRSNGDKQRQLSSKRGLGFWRPAAEGKEQVKKRRGERNHFVTVKTWPKWPLKPTNHFHLSRIKCRTWPKRWTVRLFTTKIAKWLDFRLIRPHSTIAELL